MSDLHPAIHSAADFSTAMLARIREELATKQLLEHVCVVATGSFGRHEASGESDVDFFILHDATVASHDAHKCVAEVASWIKGVVPKAPSPDGAFSAAQSIEQMHANIGGRHDENDKMTRRMLLLLEGTYLYNQDLFERVRRGTIELYVRKTITTHALARFLLNDIIRYYRTMCVDFEYKTEERRKAWVFAISS